MKTCPGSAAPSGSPTSREDTAPGRGKYRYNKEWRDKNPTRMYKLAAVMSYGGCCKRCFNTDIRVLQFDHVNGGSKNDKKFVGNRVYYYRQLMEEVDSGTYQLLCSNCNWIKRHENGERGGFPARASGAPQPLCVGSNE